MHLRPARALGLSEDPFNRSPPLPNRVRKVGWETTSVDDRRTAHTGAAASPEGAIERGLAHVMHIDHGEAGALHDTVGSIIGRGRVRGIEETEGKSKQLLSSN